MDTKGDTTMKTKSLHGAAAVQAAIDTHHSPTLSDSQREVSQQGALVAREVLHAATINTEDEFHYAASVLVGKIAPAKRALDAVFVPMVDKAKLATKAARDSQKQIVDTHRAAAAPLVAAKVAIDGAMSKFRALDEQRKLAAAREIEAAAREKFAAEERVRRQKLQEQALDDERTLEVEAEKLIDQGNYDAAAALLNDVGVNVDDVDRAADDSDVADFTAPPMCITPIAAHGVSVRKLPRVRVLDITKVNVQFLTLNDKLARQCAKEHGKNKAEQLMGIGGIEVYFEDSKSSVR